MPKREVQIELTLPREIVRPGDTLVVRAGSHIDQEKGQALLDTLLNAMPDGARAVVVCFDGELAVVRGEVRTDSRPRCPKCEHVMEGHVTGATARVCDHEWCACVLPLTFDQEYGA